MKTWLVPSQPSQCRSSSPPSLFLILLFVIIVCSYLHPVNSQYFEFDDVPIPESKHVLSLFRYFAHVPNDPPPLSVNGIPIGLSPVEALKIPLFGSNQSTIDNHPEPLKARRSLLPPQPHTAETENLPPLRLLSDRGPSHRQLQSNGTWGHAFLDLLENLWGEKSRVVAAQQKLEGDIRDQNKKVTEIVFDNLRFTTAELNETNATQVSVLSYNDFWNVFFPTSLDESKKFCCDQEEFDRGGCTQLNQLIIPDKITTFKSVVVGPHSLGTNSYGFELPTSDMYILLFSNCGMSQPNAAIRGSVYLHNYYGYLPGIEAPKVSFYIILATFYVFLLLVFGILALRHRSQLIHLHTAIAIVLTMCLIEALVWFSFYRHWNEVPNRSTIFLGTSIVITVIKNILAFMLVLVASLGWGITNPSLSKTTKRKIYLIIAAYVIFDSARQIMTQFRLSHELPFLLVLSCILPVSLLHGIIFFWIFSSLGLLIEELSAKNQEIKLGIFTKFWTLLVVTMVAAIIFLCAQVFVMSRESPDKWKDEWIFSDVAPHWFFIMVLIAMMILWAPSRSSRAMAYSSELPSEDPLDPAASNFGPNVLGRESVYRDYPHGQTVEDDEYNRIEMSAADAEHEKRNPKVWGKPHTTIKDLDYDDDEV